MSSNNSSNKRQYNIRKQINGNNTGNSRSGRRNNSLNEKAVSNPVPGKGEKNR